MVIVWTLNPLKQGDSMKSTTRRTAIALTGTAAIGLFIADLEGWLDNDLPALAQAYRLAFPGIEHLGNPADQRLPALLSRTPAKRRQLLLTWITEDATVGHITYIEGWPTTAIESALAARF